MNCICFSMRNVSIYKNIQKIIFIKNCMNRSVKYGDHQLQWVSIYELRKNRGNYLSLCHWSRGATSRSFHHNPLFSIIWLADAVKASDIHLIYLKQRKVHNRLENFGIHQKDLVEIKFVVLSDAPESTWFFGFNSAKGACRYHHLNREKNIIRLFTFSLSSHPNRRCIRH